MDISIVQYEINILQSFVPVPPGLELLLEEQLKPCAVGHPGVLVDPGEIRLVAEFSDILNLLFEPVEVEPDVPGHLIAVHTEHELRFRLGYTSPILSRSSGLLSWEPYRC